MWNIFSCHFILIKNTINTRTHTLIYTLLITGTLEVESDVEEKRCDRKHEIRIGKLKL